MAILDDLTSFIFIFGDRKSGISFFVAKSISFLDGFTLGAQSTGVWFCILMPLLRRSWWMTYSNPVPKHQVIVVDLRSHPADFIPRRMSSTTRTHYNSSNNTSPWGVHLLTYLVTFCSTQGRIVSFVFWSCQQSEVPVLRSLHGREAFLWLYLHIRCWGHLLWLKRRQCTLFILNRSLSVPFHVVQSAYKWISLMYAYCVVIMEWQTGASLTFSSIMCSIVVCANHDLAYTL